MRDAGNAYDFNPPARPDPSKRGEAHRERNKAMQFIRDSLAMQNDQIGNHLCGVGEVRGKATRSGERSMTSIQPAKSRLTGG